MARMKRLTAKELEAKDQNSVEATPVEAETEGAALASTANDTPVANEGSLEALDSSSASLDDAQACPQADETSKED